MTSGLTSPARPSGYLQCILIFFAYEHESAFIGDRNCGFRYGAYSDGTERFYFLHDPVEQAEVTPLMYRRPSSDKSSTEIRFTNVEALIEFFYWNARSGFCKVFGYQFMGRFDVPNTVYDLRKSF